MNESQKPDRPTGGGAGAMSVLVFGFGAAAGLLLAFAGAGFVEDSGGLIVTMFLSALVVAGGVGLLLFLFRGAIMRRLFGYADAQVEAFADPIARLAAGAMQRNVESATAAGRDLVALGLARYSWLTTRRWIVTSLTALIAAMAALAGTALLFKQNALLEAQTLLLSEQNSKIEAQSALLSQDLQLAEAARNAELATEISAIGAALGETADRIMEPVESVGAGMGDTYAALLNVLDPLTDLDRKLMLRIVSTSRAARPYRFLDLGVVPYDDSEMLRAALEHRKDDLPETWARLQSAFGWAASEATSRVIDRPASPERGQLFQTLVAAGVRDLDVLNHLGLDLSYAYLPGQEITWVRSMGGRMSFADFSGGQITESDLGGSWLTNARFDKAQVVRSDFSVAGAERVRPPFPVEGGPFGTFLSGASFRQAQIVDTSFAGAQAMAADFDGALLVRTDFRDAVLGAATFRRAVLIDTDFGGADLKSVDFDGAIVFGADFLEKLSAAAPERFRPDRFRLDPVGADELVAVPMLRDSIHIRDLASESKGMPAFRIVRIGSFED